MNDFDARYKALKQLVDGSLERLFAAPALGGLNEDQSAYVFPENRVWDAMQHAVMAGGKRLRPILTISTAELLGVKNVRALKVANAIEILHTYSLVHDDLPAMDNSDLRRGNPTVHKAFDEATAVLAGDGLLTLAFGELAGPTAHRSAEVRTRLSYHMALNAGVNGMVGGQMLDMMTENTQIDLETLKRLQSRKTGALIRFSTMAGVFLADLGQPKGKDDPLHAMRRYGEKLGLAFQIVDDVLDVVGDPELTGKPTGGDAAAGKSTFVTHLGLEGAQGYAGQLIESAKDELSFAGEDGWFLRGLADFVLARVS